MHLVAHLRGGKQQIFAQTLTAMKRAPSWARWETEPKGRKGSGSKGQGGRDKGSFGSSKGGSYDGKGPFGREGKSGGGSGKGAGGGGGAAGAGGKGSGKGSGGRGGKQKWQRGDGGQHVQSCSHTLREPEPPLCLRPFLPKAPKPHLCATAGSLHFGTALQAAQVSLGRKSAGR